MVPTIAIIVAYEKGASNDISLGWVELIARGQGQTMMHPGML